MAVDLLDRAEGIATNLLIIDVANALVRQLIAFLQEFLHGF